MIKYGKHPRTEAPCMSCGVSRDEPPRGGGILMRCLQPSNHRKPDGSTWICIGEHWTLHVPPEVPKEKK